MELRFTKTKKHGSLPKSEKLIYYGKKTMVIYQAIGDFKQTYNFKALIYYGKLWYYRKTMVLWKKKTLVLWKKL